MSKGTFLKTSPLFAAALAITGAGVFTGAGPAQAADCQQWAFPGPVTLRSSTGETANFAGNGPHAGAPATWQYPNNGPKHNGNVNGDIDPSGHITVTYFENDGTTVNFTGQVGPDGMPSGNRDPGDVTWTSLAPMTCAQSGPKEGPSITLDPILGGLVIHVTDHSGTTSQCQYGSDFVSRSFKLPANSTVDLKIVPAVPLFVDHPVDITCDNGAVTHTSAFF
jgi:hypothetical protein